MSERRKFTDSFRLNQIVSVIRTEHGWYDGSVTGKIVKISEYGCVVRDNEGVDYDILKPRDII